MAFPLYFVYMVESAMVSGEIAKPVENPVKKYFKTEVFDEVDTLGREFFTPNRRHARNLGDWEVKNDRGSIKRKLDISKGKEKQHLTINFENQLMSGLDFTLSDGKTIVSLQKNDEGKLVVLRKDIKGTHIPGAEDLSPREYMELSNFPVKLWIDRNVNSILDTVRQDKIFKYVVPATLVATFGGSAALAHFGTPNNATTLNQAFFNRPTVSQADVIQSKSSRQSVPKIIKKTENRPTLTSLDIKIGDDSKSVTDSQEASNIKMDSLGILQEYGLISKFYDPEKPLTQPRDEAIRDFLKSRKEYVGVDGQLVGNIEPALKEVKANPESEDSFYALLDAIHEFNTGHGIVTPKKILSQANGAGDNVRSAYLDTKDKVTGEPEFNKGLINGNEAFDYILPGDFITTEDNHNGLVASIKKDKSGNLLSVNVVSQNGILTVSASDYPIGFSYLAK